MILGADAESEFKVQVENLGWLWEKVPDKDEENRYDFDVLSNRDFHRVEVKEGQYGIVSVNFRDGKDVRLPSGRIWRTTARNKSEDFDFLAVYVEEEFRLLPFSVLSPLKPRNSKDFIFTNDEKEWLAANYLCGSVNINKFPEWIRLDDL